MIQNIAARIDKMRLVAIAIVTAGLKEPRLMWPKLKTITPRAIPGMNGETTLGMSAMRATQKTRMNVPTHSASERRAMDFTVSSPKKKECVAPIWRKCDEWHVSEHVCYRQQIVCTSPVGTLGRRRACEMPSHGIFH